MADPLLKLGALRHGIGREIGIVTPWIDRTKAQILQAVHADDREHGDVRDDSADGGGGGTWVRG